MTQDVLSTAFFDKEYTHSLAAFEANSLASPMTSPTTSPETTCIGVLLLNFSLGDKQQLMQALTYQSQQFKTQRLPGQSMKIANSTARHSNIKILDRSGAYNADVIVANIRQTHAEKALQLFRRLHPDTPMLLIGDADRVDHRQHPLVITDIDPTSNSLERRIRKLFDKAQAQQLALESEATRHPCTETNSSKVEHRQTNVVAVNKPTQQGHILVVDDSVSVRQQMQHYLNKRGFNCTTAGNAEEALYAAHEQTYDLVFLDIIMPKINGFRTCQALRKLPQYKNTPVIMLTAEDSSVNRIHAMMSGCNRYTLKPLRSKNLEALLMEFFPDFQGLTLSRSQWQGDEPNLQEALTPTAPGSVRKVVNESLDQPTVDATENYTIDGLLPPDSTFTLPVKPLVAADLGL